MKPLRIALGEIVRELREERELSQERLAQQAKISRTFQGEIERGEKAATVDIVERLSRALKVTVAELFALAEKRR